MASLIHESKQRQGWRLYCYDAVNSRRRRSIWLGEMPPRDAATVKRHVEAIVESQKYATPMPGETVRWLARLPAGLHRKLLPLLGAARTVRQAAESYLDWVADNNKPSTHRSAAGTLGQLCDTFGTRQMRTLAADELDRWLDTRNVAPNTVGKHAKNLKTFLRWCRGQGWVDDLQLATPSTVGRGDKSYLATDGFQQLINSFGDCPQSQAALALSRWAGVRVPSELLLLSRSSIDWENSRVHVEDAKKTKRSSRAPPVVRQCPLFPELAPYLLRIWAADGKPTDPLLPAVVAMGGPAFVARVDRARDRLGMEWPRLFTSVRATRETELIARFGVRAASEWLGNSPLVAGKFYELVPSAVWEEATACVSPTTTHTTNKTAG